MTEIDSNEILKTGTTIVGIVAKDAIILAGDQQATLGHLVSDKAFRKVDKVSDKIGICGSGVVGDNQVLLRFLKARANTYKIEHGTDIGTTRLVNLLATILNENRFYPYYSSLIIGGYVGKPELYTIDAIGGFNLMKHFGANGSGSVMAYGTLEDLYKPNMTTEETVTVAVKAIRAARERDIYSGGETIDVATITKTGMTYVDNKVVKDIVEGYQTRTMNA